jgi:hypothetical protein
LNEPPGSRKTAKIPEIDFDNFPQGLTFPSPVGVVAQLVERLNGIQEVRGSNPLGSTILPCKDTPFRVRVSTVKEIFINVEERIDKVVGRRTRLPDAFRSGMQLQSLAVELHRSLGHRWASKGVYRFRTHEEADEWMNRMLARSQTQKT